MKKIKTLVLITLLVLLGCQQTGGYQIVTGKQAKKEISKKTDIVFATGFWLVFNSVYNARCTATSSSSTSNNPLLPYFEGNFIGNLIRQSGIVVYHYKN